MHKAKNDRYLADIVKSRQEFGYEVTVTLRQRPEKDSRFRESLVESLGIRLAPIPGEWSLIGVEKENDII
jgi:hypothetical protein